MFLIALVSFKSGSMELSNSVTEKIIVCKREMNLRLNNLILPSCESSLCRVNILPFCLNIWKSVSSEFWSIPVQSIPAQKWLLASASPCGSIRAQQSNSVQKQPIPNVYLSGHPLPDLVHFSLLGLGFRHYKFSWGSTCHCTFTQPWEGFN